MRHELHTQNRLRELARLAGALLRDLHAAALAAPARVNLGLDDDDRAARLLRELP
jgi:hypothetical protein